MSASPDDSRSPALRAPEIALTALRVFDLARSVAFYVDGCGLFRVHDISTDTFDAIIVGQRNGAGGGVELIRERDPAAAIEPGSGFAKLVMSVDDVEGTTTASVECGGTVVMAPRALEHLGGLVLSTVRDPDGYIVEFVQRASS
ncbi:hypothetical protein CH272_18605 [Rhodococcus sp. 05-340-1]|uniref:VOC family protein n=1 Tax=Nocardiaceae TaxID=85025 RepID=UPI00068B01BF|nr:MULTISPECIES: VOC family protein [Rhodococcus]OZC87716.1 hypothetical protein CH254_14195 [Rhodococcus sp. 06-412-2C]OZC96367.1 hypothetical protein CH279_14365 [Rhodococcus sp. 06-412-2B]OZD65351.1 hypothetical protein CH271_20185 [Rhodococcus sp. 05-340-2]OZD74603.1 hypothetical protein CH272_18605 [Rhodococcus sp. 05-340-1]OZD86624.1 hypothetical protein CH273_00420 [Rhodococcus sp. 05-339-2]